MGGVPGNVIHPVITNPQPEHIGGLGALFKLCAPGMVGRPCNPENTLVAVHDGQVIGVAMVWGAGMPYGWIDCFYVLPKYRNQGVGVWLVEAAEKLLLSQGVTAIRAYATKDTYNLLKRAGYQEREVCTIMERDHGRLL